MISLPGIFLLIAHAFAQSPGGMGDDMSGGTPQPGQSSQKTTAEYLSDLESEDNSDRLMAARVLRSNLKRALRVEANATPGSLRYDDARSLLVELEERLPSACVNALAYPNVVAPCAEMLAMLEVTSAIPEIERVLAIETRKKPRQRIEVALGMLKGTGPV